MKQFIFAATILVGTAMIGCDSSTMLESQPAHMPEVSALDKSADPIPSFEGTFDFSEIIDFASGEIGSTEESETAKAFGTVEYAIWGSSQDRQVASVSLSVNAKLRPRDCGVVAYFSGQSSEQVRLPASGTPASILEVYHSEDLGLSDAAGDFVLCIMYMVDRNGVSIETVWLGDDMLPF